MRMTSWFVTALAVAHSLTALSAPPGLPEVQPPFAPSKTGRQQAELKTFNVLEPPWNPTPKRRPNPTLVSGNKSISVNGLNAYGFEPSHTITVFVNGRKLAAGQFWGSTKDAGYGYPFKLKDGAESKVSFDTNSRSITFSKECELTPAAEPVVYSHTLKALDSGQVRLNWDLGLSSEAYLKLREKLYFHPSFSFDAACRALGVSIDGERLALSPVEEIKQLTPSQSGVRGRPLKSFKNCGMLTVAPDNPLEGFSLVFDGKADVTVNEQYYQDRYSLYVTASSPDLPTGAMVIDFGTVALAAAEDPPPLGGVDFWATDRMHIPAPTTRNLMPNPSFEQGLRYWTWWSAGGIIYSPSNIPCYEITRDAKVGRQALRSNGTQGNKHLTSFPIPVELGKEYTLSFYAKADQPVPFILGAGSDWGHGLSQKWQVGKDWERKTCSFKATGKPFVQIYFQGWGVTIDGVQLEEGGKATAFVGPVVEGRLATAHPDNSLQPGQPFDAVLELHGTPELSGEAVVTVFNYYRETVYGGKLPFSLDKDGGARLALPIDPKPLGEGVFVVRAEYRTAGEAPLVDYYRLSVMTYLEGKHATREFFGNLDSAGRITRGDDLARMTVRWGWGATHPVNANRYEFYESHGVPNYCATIEDLLDTDQQKALYGEGYLKYGDRGSAEFRTRLDSLTSKEELVEKISFDLAKKYPGWKRWTWSGESDGRSTWIRTGNFAEHAKLIRAMRRGIKRANPDAIVLPDQGPANMESGWKQIDAFLSPVTTEGKFKWDAVAIHPYIYPDDLDARTAALVALMAKYGYGPETPIYFTEAGNVTDVNLPQWGENGCYDSFWGGRPTYDTGWREFLKAAWDARLYLVGLKYWPHIQYVSIWTSRTTFDLSFAPLMDCKMVNTLGHLFGNPKFVADISPIEGVKGMAFTDETGRGLAAVWSTGNGGDAERGLKPGPKLRVNFGSDIPEFIDLMGNIREAKPKDGLYEIPLCPAPLFVRGPDGSAARLAAALNAAEVVGAGSVIKAEVFPNLDGRLTATLANKTAGELDGTLTANGKPLPFRVPASGKTQVVLAEGLPTAPGVMGEWKGTLNMALSNGSATSIDWSLAWFFVPHAATPLPLNPDAPEWKTIPAFPLTNWHMAAGATGGQLGDLDAKFQLAWDKDNLYLRVDCADDHFLVEPELWKAEPPPVRARKLYDFDGCAEVYFDTYANARGNLGKGHDQDDYRFDFYAGDGAAANGTGTVCRLYRVFHQLAGGLTFPTDEEAAKAIQCQFIRDGNRYRYVMGFPQRQIQPLELVKGYTAGFGLYIHDKEPGDKDPKKGLSLATEPGAHCNHRPDLYPLMILKE